MNLPFLRELVPKQSVTFAGCRAVSFFNLIVLFLYPFPNYFRPALSSRLTAFIQPFKRFTVKPDSQHIVLRVIGCGTAYFCNHSITTFLLLQQLYTVATKMSSTFFI